MPRNERTRRNKHVANSHKTRSRIASQHATLGESVWDHRHRPDPGVSHCAPHRHCPMGPPHAVKTMSPGLRKFVRTAHVTFTVGWLGAVAGFLALAITGLTSQDTQIVRAAYLAMELITRFVIVPLSLAPLLLTGPLLSLGTPWGLFRHYWILAKLLINILSTLILLVHMQPISYLSRVAAAGTWSNADLGLQIEMVVASSGAALLALLVATGLAVYKPCGMTPHGWRKQYEERSVSQSVDTAT